MNILPKNAIIEIRKNEIICPIPQGLAIIESNITLNEIHNMFIDIDFNNFYKNIGGKGARSEQVESLRMPPFAFIYYYLFCINKNIPSPQLVCETYKKAYCIENLTGYSLKSNITNKPNVIFSEYELYGRICRAYNSFNREIDLLFQLFESSSNDFDIFYSIQMDFYNGIDIAIVYDNILYGIASYVKTQNSLKFREMKNSFRHKYNDIILIPVVAKFDNNMIIYKDIMVHNSDTGNKILTSIIKKDLTNMIL